jgi:hypothetical protein
MQLFQGIERILFAVGSRRLLVYLVVQIRNYLLYPSALGMFEEGPRGAVGKLTLGSADRVSMQEQQPRHCPRTNYRITSVIRTRIPSFRV